MDKYSPTQKLLAIQEMLYKLLLLASRGYESETLTCFELLETQHRKWKQTLLWFEKIYTSPTDVAKICEFFPSPEQQVRPAS